MIPLVKMSFLVILISTSGCKIVEVNANPQKDSIMKEGINVHGVEPGAFQKPLIEQGAVVVEVAKPLVEIHPNSIAPGAVTVQPEAVKFTIEKGAFTVMPGAVTVNVLPQKPPQMNINSIVENLKKNIKPIGDISTLPKDQQNRIIENSTILHNTIENLLDIVKQYNEKYADK